MGKIVPVSKLWTGCECEGRYTGLHTLFVQGPVPYSDIEDAIDSEAISHVYFGAGKTTPDTQIPSILKLFNFPHIFITVETVNPSSLPPQILQRAHIIFRHESPNTHLLKPSDTIKIETTHQVHCITKSQCYTNDFDCYKHDRPIE